LSTLAWYYSGAGDAGKGHGLSVDSAFFAARPDIILVGETRDKETAKTAIEAALTGHWC